VLKAPQSLVLDADFFISYLRADELADNVEKLLDLALEGRALFFASSELYDDLITAYRSKGYSVKEVERILVDIEAIPHETLPLTLKTAILAMDLYAKYGGSRKLHYFDAFHVATSIIQEKQLLTSDRFILENSHRMGVRTTNLRKV